jgi:hypothetical protein
MTRSRLMTLSVVSVILVAALVGGATFALFTAQSLNHTNNFTAGTLAIANADKTPWDVMVGNMAPGDVFEKTITVTNTGSLELEFAGTFSRTGAIFAGTNKALVDLLNGYGVLAPGASQDVTVRVTLPLAADNSYQTATGNVTVTFHAFQTRNLTNAVGTFVQTNDNAANGSNLYDGYLLNDGANTVPLTDGNLLAMYEVRPDGTVNYLVTTPDPLPPQQPDPKFWLNNAKPNGTYNYVVVTKSGIRYTASIVHVQN